MPILEFFPYIYLGLPIKISADTAFMSPVDKGGVRLPPYLMLIESMLSFGRFLSYAILVSSLETLDTFCKNYLPEFEENRNNLYGFVMSIFYCSILSQKHNKAAITYEREVTVDVETEVAAS